MAGETPGSTKKRHRDQRPIRRRRVPQRSTSNTLGDAKPIVGAAATRIGRRVRLVATRRTLRLTRLTRDVRIAFALPRVLQVDQSITLGRFRPQSSCRGIARSASGESRPLLRELRVARSLGSPSAAPRAPLRRSRKARTGRNDTDLVFGRAATDAFYASTLQARANAAWKAAGLEPITPHEARHCAISYFIAAGLDWKQISTWAGHGDVRQTWNRYGHLVPGGEREAADRLSRTRTARLWRSPQQMRKAPRIRGLRASTATGIRTRVSAVKGRRLSPLDDSGETFRQMARTALGSCSISKGSG